jgi:hypothetical protein
MLWLNAPKRELTCAKMRFPLAFYPHGAQNARFSPVFHSLMPETRIKSGFRASQPAAPCCTMAQSQL